MSSRYPNELFILYSAASHCFPNVDFWFITQNKAQGTWCMCVCYVNTVFISRSLVSVEWCLAWSIWLIEWYSCTSWTEIWVRALLFLFSFWNSLDALLPANCVFHFTLNIILSKWLDTETGTGSISIQIIDLKYEYDWVKYLYIKSCDGGKTIIEYLSKVYLFKFIRELFFI